MSQQTLNPWQRIAELFAGTPGTTGNTNGMNYLIANVGVTPNNDDLVNTIFAWINSNNVDWYSTIPISLEIELKGVGYNAINGFVNGPLGNYNANQMRIISMLIGPSFVDGMTPNTILDRIGDIEDNITKAGLTAEQQTPLLIATAIGKIVYPYLLTEINDTATPSPWYPFFDQIITGGGATNLAANRAYWVSNSINEWVAAAMRGALIGAGSGCSCKGGGLDPSTDGSGNQLLGSLIGALIGCAGRVIFKWIPRIQNFVAVDTPINDVFGGQLNSGDRIIYYLCGDQSKGDRWCALLQRGKSCKTFDPTPCTSTKCYCADE